MAGRAIVEDVPTNAAASLPRIGSYRLTKPLGSGGMSSVYRAEHVDTGLEVAVKILPRSLAKNPTLLQRFIREAKSAESLEHPSIVAIYDRGFDDGRHYLVLELVSGGDLHDYIRNNGRMSPSEAARVIRAAAEGLSYAADRGVIHRDVKPANLLLTEDGKVKVTDLGLALQIENEDERVTRDGTTVGTVDYMAPEQARDSRATSVRSDIYSLGCTFYYLLTGQPPFAGGDITDKLRRHATEPPPDIRRLRPEVSPQLGQLIRRMMAKNPENRDEGYSELIAAIDALPDFASAPSDDLPSLVPLEEDHVVADFELGPRGRSDSSRRVLDSTIETSLRTPDPRNAGRPHTPNSAARFAPARPAAASPSDSRLFRQMLDDEEAEPGLPPPIYESNAAYRHASESLGPYILRGALIGVIIAVALLGIRALVGTDKSPETSSATTRDDSPDAHQSNSDAIPPVHDEK